MQLNEMVGQQRYHDLVNLGRYSAMYGIVLDSMTREDLFAVVAVMHEQQRMIRRDLQHTYSFLLRER